MDLQKLIFALLFFGFLIASEFLFGIYKKRNAYKDLKDASASLTLGILYLLFQIIVGGFMLSIDLELYNHKLFNFGYKWHEIILCFLLMDFTYYWWHRVSHRVRFLWANHINHHSSEEYNFTTALRQPFFVPILRPLFYIHIPLLGFDPKLVGILGAVGLVSAVWTHTKLIPKLGFLEYILVTPSAHRVHHGSNHEYLDKNYGGTFIFWDIIFGTFQKEVNEVKYGLTTNINTYNPFKIISHEWFSWVKDIKSSRSIKEAIDFTIQGPEKIEALRQANINNS